MYRTLLKLTYVIYPLTDKKECAAASIANGQAVGLIDGYSVEDCKQQLKDSLKKINMNIVQENE
jgi:hypothetical protein